jgi:integrase/recombinase XerD
LTGEELAPATIHSTVNSVKRFFVWLAMHPGYKRRITLGDTEYLNLAERDVRAASAPSDKAYPTLQMVERVVALMPSETAIEKRDRALIAFTAITGIRDGALVSLKLKHFDANRCLVLQNPAKVSPKFGKRIDTFLFPLGETFEAIFHDWLHTLRVELLFGDGNPMFPKTDIGQDENNCFTASGLSRDHWAAASPVRAIFKEAFRRADLPEFTPHRFRHMIVAQMYARGLSIAEFKAWSQNLGHEGAMTTLTSYGKIGLEEQGRLVRRTPDIQSDAPVTRRRLGGDFGSPRFVRGNPKWSARALTHK